MVKTKHPLSGSKTTEEAGGNLAEDSKSKRVRIQEPATSASSSSSSVSLLPSSSSGEEDPAQEELYDYKIEPPAEPLVTGETFADVQKRLSGSSTSSQWSRIGISHHHGVVVPLSALRTTSSRGCGEFLDLIQLIDWCASLREAGGKGFDVIQLLPLNDTSEEASFSPFSARSSFALNPLNISLAAISHNAAGVDEEIWKELNQLNALDRIDWKTLREKKLRWLRKCFESNKSQYTDSEPAFNDFVSRNSYWLESYAIFCIIKQIFGEQNSWEEWPEPYRSGNTFLSQKESSENQEKGADSGSAMSLKEFKSKWELEIKFQIWLQFLCDLQLSQAKEHAKLRAVKLKGDLPFLVGRDSADVWARPNLFRMEFSAGAPPDMYAADGQDWGMPLYDWDAMKKEDYRWWRERLAASQRYFDLYRIDHVVGIYRVWGIARGRKATQGRFHPPEVEKWIVQGEEILKMMIESSNMLPIAEDLGTVPSAVRASLQRMGICGTKVVRWEREWDKEGKPFIPLDQYNRDSMTTVSTHDSSPLISWWSDEPEEAQAFAKEKGWSYKAGEKISQGNLQSILAESHRSSSLFHINPLQEYLALSADVKFVRDNLKDERINLPGTTTDFNWSYRFLKPISDMNSSKELNESIRSIIPLDLTF